MNVKSKYLKKISKVFIPEFKWIIVLGHLYIVYSNELESCIVKVTFLIELCNDIGYLVWYKPIR